MPGLAEEKITIQISTDQVLVLQMLGQHPNPQCKQSSRGRHCLLEDLIIPVTFHLLPMLLGQHRINAKNRIIQWVPNKNCE